MSQQAPDHDPTKKPAPIWCGLSCILDSWRRSVPTAAADQNADGAQGEQRDRRRFGDTDTVAGGEQRVVEDGLLTSAIDLPEGGRSGAGAVEDDEGVLARTDRKHGRALRHGETG